MTALLMAHIDGFLYYLLSFFSIDGQNEKNNIRILNVAGLTACLACQLREFEYFKEQLQ